MLVYQSVEELMTPRQVVRHLIASCHLPTTRAEEDTAGTQILGDLVGSTPPDERHLEKI